MKSLFRHHIVLENKNRSEPRKAKDYERRRATIINISVDSSFKRTLSITGVKSVGKAGKKKIYMPLKRGKARRICDHQEEKELRNARGR